MLLNFLVKFLASNIRILKECEFCNIAFSFSVTPIVLYKLRSKPTSTNKLSSLSECRFYNTVYDDNSLIVESGQSSEALHQHGLPKLREWSGGGHCQCFLARASIWFASSFPSSASSPHSHRSCLALCISGRRSRILQYILPSHFGSE